MSVNLNRGFAPSPQDQGMLLTSLNFQINQRFTDRVAGTLGVNLRDCRLYLVSKIWAICTEK